MSLTPLEAVAHFAGWTYGRPRLPTSLRLPPAVPSSVLRSPIPSTTDCSTLCAAVVLACHPTSDRAVYVDLQVAHGDPTRPWSAIEAASRLAGGPIHVQTAPPVGELHLVQLWRGLSAEGHLVSGSRGHQVLARVVPGGLVTVWEASELEGRVVCASWASWEALVDKRQARATRIGGA